MRLHHDAAQRCLKILVSNTHRTGRRRGFMGCAAATLLLTTAPCAKAAQYGNDNWTQSGNIIQIALPLAALGLSFWTGSDDSSDFASSYDLSADNASGSPGLNWPGPRLSHSAPVNVGIALMRTEVVTYALKYAINERRPNGGSHSFPSGHSAGAFMGAEYIRKSYGWGWGAPAYAAATWVGYTRVQSHNHYWRDVFAGAAIGIAANHDFDNVDTPIGQLSIMPTLLPIETPDDQLRMVPGISFSLSF